MANNMVYDPAELAPTSAKHAEFVDLIRFTLPSGRVYYKILDTAGQVHTANTASILDYITPQQLQCYEHMAYAGGRNMETKYDFKESMGGWRGGTTNRDVADADKRLREAARRR